MSNPWFRVYTEILTDPKMGELTDSEFRTWIEILAFACQTGNEGETKVNRKNLKWCLKRRGVERHIEKLIALSMLKIADDENGHIIVTNWNKRQFKSDTSRDRMREYRHRQRNCDVTVTSGDAEGVTPPDTDAEYRTDKNKSTPPIPPRKKSKPKKPPKKTFLKFVKLTEDEHAELIESLGKRATDDLIFQLNNYIGRTGKKYKSHYYTILNWARKDGAGKTDQPKFVKRSECYMCHRIFDIDKLIHPPDMRESFVVCSLCNLKKEWQ